MESNLLTLYCICRSPDIDRFMIMCDQCEEWYHGDCINITEKESRKIKYFYCKWCRRKDPALKVQYRKTKKSHEKEAKKLKKAKKSKEEVPRPMKKKRMSETEKPKAKLDKVGQVKQKPPPVTVEPPVPPKKIPDDFIKKESEDPESFMLGSKQSEEKTVSKLQNSTETFTPSKPPADTVPESLKNIPKKESAAAAKLVKREIKYPPKVKIKEYSGNEYLGDIAQPRDIDISYQISRKKPRLDVKHSGSRQCLGPGCTSAARSSSKYCSDECGERLAEQRLNLIMPSRVHQWHNTPTVANEVGSAELERIRSSMTQARSELQSLEANFHRLESIIKRSKTFPIREGASDTEDGDEGDQNIYCVVCGHPVSLRNAIKHMDRCYIKMESQMSFGSVYPTRVEGSERLFCDVYNRQQQTYCKRLQVLCPEHTKEPKIGPSEVCGCPIKNDIYDGDEPTSGSEFCSRAKRKCNKHFKWETMYRACVDLQRIRQWLKIDEIFEEERRIRGAMAARAGVIPILLHNTQVHDPKCLDMRTKPSHLKRPAYRLVI